MIDFRSADRNAYPELAEYADNDIYDRFIGCGGLYLATNMGVSNGAAITFKYTLYESQRVIKAVCVEGGIITKPLKSMICTLMLLFPEILMPTKKNMKLN